MRIFIGTYKACSAQGREGWIIYRGRTCRGGPRQWEIWLVESGGENVKMWVDDFDSIADAILRWLRGNDMSTSLAPAESHNREIASGAIPLNQTNLPARWFDENEDDVMSSFLMAFFSSSDVR